MMNSAMTKSYYGRPNSKSNACLTSDALMCFHFTFSSSHPFLLQHGIICNRGIFMLEKHFFLLFEFLHVFFDK